MKKRAFVKFDAEEWQRFDGSWTEFVKANLKAYLQRPDVKARHRDYQKAYNQRKREKHDIQA